MKSAQLMQELEEIKKDITYIKANMVDKDMVLSQEDLKSLSETVKEKKQGKLISLKQIQKDLGCN